MPGSKRYRAVRSLTIERKGKPPLRVDAGKEVKGAPDGWPSRSVIERGLVTEIEEESSSSGTGSSKKPNPPSRTAADDSKET